ncbi:MAG: glycosyltransferase family 2 protein [Candidatus Lokiarchaeota archaeon]
MPAYNEEENIERVINEIKLTMNREQYNYQILVLDDGSEDKTKKIAEKNGALVFSNSKNLGLAKTFYNEMKICLNLNADIIVHTDADGQYPAIYIPKLIENVIKGDDLVLGCRFVEGIYSGNVWKKFGNLFFAKILSLLLRKHIKDTTTGFRAFNRDVAKLRIQSKFTYTQEQIIRAIRGGKKVKEIPIETRETRGSHLFNNILEYFYRAIITILKTFL